MKYEIRPSKVIEVSIRRYITLKLCDFGLDCIFRDHDRNKFS